MSHPRAVILAGPNGAGKSTLAPMLIHRQLRIADFVNADTIAQGLSAFDAQSKALEAGRLMLEHLRALAAQRQDFAWETTLATRFFANWCNELRADGYELGLIFIWLPSADFALQRVAARVAQGGHSVPENVVRRRFQRGLDNFFSLYRARVDWWRMYNGEREEGPAIIAQGAADAPAIVKDERIWLRLTNGRSK